MQRLRCSIRWRVVGPESAWSLWAEAGGQRLKAPISAMVSPK
jgi:hypothetical protein